MFSMIIIEKSLYKDRSDWPMPARAGVTSRNSLKRASGAGAVATAAGG